MSNTISYCGCKTDSVGNINGARFQDSKYGPGIRVHVVGKDQICCSVCGKHTKVNTPKKEAKSDGKKN